MKRVIFTLSILTALVSCSENDANMDSMASRESTLDSNSDSSTSTSPNTAPASISGTFEGGSGSLLQLNYIGEASLESKGNETLGADGSFSFKLDQVQKGFYNVQFSEQNSFVVYLEPGTEIVVNAHADSLFSTYNLKTSNEDSKLIQTFFRKSNQYFKEMQAINEKMDELKFSADSQRSKYIRESDQRKADFNAFKRKFIEDNINSPVMVFLFEHLNPQTESDYINRISESVQRSLAGTHYSNYARMAAQQANQVIAQQKQQELMATAASRIQPGKMAPDLEFPNPDGQLIKLSDLRGKVVLLDFWASWCKPCRAENPNVVRMYNHYKDKGFDIFSFSLDKVQQRWVNAIETDGLIWEHHASDLKGWDTEVLPLYGFNGIPFTVLIDKDGKIIEKNLRGAALENKLKSILG